MSRKFVTDREVAFINAVSRELVQHVSDQWVHYYEVRIEESQPHRLYNEMVRKVWSAPVRIDARVEWDNPQTTTAGPTVDSKYTLAVFFHTQELVDRNVVPREGDFIEYGQVFFEISSVTHPQLIFGQINNKLQTKCVCVPSREGQFRAGSDSSEGIDSSHSVEQSIGVNR